MSYRDDLDAAEARNQALERELAQAEAKIAELEGKKSRALVRAGDQSLARSAAGSPKANTYLGGPTRLELERVLDGEMPESAYTEVVESVRRAVGNVGTVSVLPGSLAWSSSAPSNSVGPFVNLYITVRDGRTVIRAEERLGQLAGALFGGVGGGVGVGGIMLPLATMWIAPALVAVAVPLWLGGWYLGCRKLFGSRARARAERMEELMDELVAIAERRIRESEARRDE